MTGKPDSGTFETPSKEAGKIMIEKLAQKYSYQNGIFTEVGKRGPKVSLNSTDMIKILLDYFPFDEVNSRLIELADLCSFTQAKAQENELDYVKLVEEILTSDDLIGNFRYLTIGKSGFLYHFQGSWATMIQLGYPSTRDWVNILLQYQNEKIVDLRDKLAPLLRPKSPFSVSLEDVASLVANSLAFSKRKELHETLASEIKPVTLSDSDEISLYKIPYKYEENPVLNSYMAEFLSRVSDADYLCAIIWLTVQGYKTPYVVYLYGTGGEGKSAFLNSLAQNIVSAAAFAKYNNFSNFSMHGKAMIVLCENTDCFLLQDQLVKQLTGNSLVTCEQKNKGIFSSTLPGTLYVDANRMLKLKGEPAEYRRLRLFKVKPPVDLKKEETFDMIAYQACLSQDFNSFLNHCRQCYEKVGSKAGWLVHASPTQEAEYITLTDKALIHNSEVILEKIKKDLNLEYYEDGELSSKLFWDTFFKFPESKERYSADNLKDYLFLHKTISDNGSIIRGLRQKPSDHTTFVLNAN